jgi:hypothetical protein
MGTATLRSILERMADHIMNININDRRPIQKKGDEKTVLKKTRPS